MKKLLLVCLMLSGMALARVPRSKHVWIITEENHSYEEILGNKSMPYYNQLAAKYTLLSQHYANQHSSLPALMWLVAGQPVTANNNSTKCYDVNNVVRQLLQRGMTWRSYQEDLPHAGFQGISSGHYVRRHNPLIDFIDACATSQRLNSVPYNVVDRDMANFTTANYTYITPNLMHDAHDGTLAQADKWLAKEVPQILARPEFRPGGDGLLFIVWDEGALSKDRRCSATRLTGCGGRVATLVIGPRVKKRFKSTRLYHHENLLRTVCDAMGFSSCPGKGAKVAPISDVFIP